MEKQNLLKLLFSKGGSSIGEEEFQQAVMRHKLLDTSNLRQRLVSVIGIITSKIGIYLIL